MLIPDPIPIGYFAFATNSHAMGSASTNHGDGHIGINGVND
jgi:hypothetical protein